MERDNNIIGSVIQRSIVLNDISPIISIASVPSVDIGHIDSMKHKMNEIFGVTTNECLTELEYNDTLKRVMNKGFWEELYEVYDSLNNHENGELRNNYSQYAANYFKSLYEDNISLSKDVLLCQLGRININNITIPWIAPEFPKGAFPRREVNYTDDFLKSHELNPDIFFLSLKTKIAAEMVPFRIEKTLNEIYKYDIPFGLSPETSSESLGRIINLTDRHNIAFAPFVAGAWGASNSLANGDPVLAIKLALGGGAATIVFVGVNCIVDYI